MPHDDIFGDGGALCFNVEVAPELLQASYESGVASPRGAWAAARLLLAVRESSDVEVLDVEEGVVGLVHALSRREATSAPRHVQRAMDLLAARAIEPWSLVQIAREVGLHPMHLARAFRRARGEASGSSCAVDAWRSQPPSWRVPSGRSRT
jgi:AraC family transcriptional regulator